MLVKFEFCSSLFISIQVSNVPYGPLVKLLYVHVSHCNIKPVNAHTNVQIDLARSMLSHLGEQMPMMCHCQTKCQ